MDIQLVKDFHSETPFVSYLQMDKEGEIESYYSPFDYINTSAKIAIVGISPGATQALNANREAARLLGAGESEETAYKQAKEFASFSGPLRKNLIRLLDHVELNKRLGIGSCDELFTDSGKHLVHNTSVFMRPVIKNGKPISSAKGFLRSPLLKRMVDHHLLHEAESLNNDVLWLPLGQGVDEVLTYLADKGVIKRNKILSGLPHPSGANAECISYFLGEKARDDLSVKTNPFKLDEAKRSIISKLEVI